MKKPITLILDTDIGSDIDDTWALAMILKSPEIDLKLVTVNEYDTEYKAKIACKQLESAGRSDIPVGMGAKGTMALNNCAKFVEGYDLSSYPNVCENAADAIIDCIMSSDEKITILAIGGFKNLKEAYEKEPRICKNSRIVAIAGNLFNTSHLWNPPLISEWNIRMDLDAWRCGVEYTPWEVELLPLDVSGGIKLEKKYNDRVREAAKADPIIGAMIECNDAWVKAENWNVSDGGTSPMFDTVGVYAVITHEHLNFEKLPIRTNDGSFTLIDPENGKLMNCATSWSDKEAFYKFLTARLCGEI